MYLKQMSPCEILVKNHLVHVGHFHGVSIRGKKDFIIDFMVISIIHELSLSEPVYIREYNIHSAGRQGLLQHNEKWFKDAITERERYQIQKYGRMVGSGMAKISEISINRAQNCLGPKFGEKINRLLINVEALLMTELNIINSMTKNEYYNYTLKKL